MKKSNFTDHSAAVRQAFARFAVKRLRAELRGTPDVAVLHRFRDPDGPPAPSVDSLVVDVARNRKGLRTRRDRGDTRELLMDYLEPVLTQIGEHDVVVVRNSRSRGGS